ncbi:hypothetical protein BJ138DRAFT_1186624 [Hygrophoropsis aurantiaca]|uniref:Uncharacterized protein n=1 Tax=Hygrophoropsis aurantiaca TaxID=72124 RepID=A0ACB7ZTE4_9AGAM|nr:hypothetical protein BJ138DRAFT_1186624 [Hygrophoropsis aurantiaca]
MSKGFQILNSRRTLVDNTNRPSRSNASQSRSNPLELASENYPGRVYSSESVVDSIDDGDDDASQQNGKQSTHTFSPPSSLEDLGSRAPAHRAPPFRAPQLCSSRIRTAPSNSLQCHLPPLTLTSAAGIGPPQSPAVRLLLPAPFPLSFPSHCGGHVWAIALAYGYLAALLATPGREPDLLDCPREKALNFVDDQGVNLLVSCAVGLTGSVLGDEQNDGEDSNGSISTKNPLNIKNIPQNILTGRGLTCGNEELFSPYWFSRTLDASIGANRASFFFGRVCLEGTVPMVFAMFNNASDIDASHSNFTEIHHDQYNSVNGVIHGNQSYHTIVHGNQIYQNSSETFEPLRKASILSVAFDSAERYPAPICLPGTRVEILNRISGWIEDEGSQPICWLSGLAGSGKSAIAQCMAEMYAEKNRLAASFFFSRREQQRSTTQHFFPTLSSQLLNSFPSTKQSIAAALDEDYTVPTKFLREQMQKLVLGPLCSMTERPESPVLIVVDSLDECDNEGLVVELIALLDQLLRQCPHPFRLLLTSWIEPHIQNAFREPSIFAMTLFLELATFDAQEDIRSFMAHAFNNIYEQHHMIVDGVQHPWPSTDELEKLLEKASGLFIFATTVVKFVGSKHHDPSARLQIILNDANISSGNTIYADLDSLYHDAVQAVNDADLVQFVLGIIRYVSNPLSIRALNIIISPLHIVNVAHILPDLGSVLLVPEDEKKPVRIYHTSFRDFLSSLLRAKCYFVDPSVYHPLLARLCLEHMCGTLKKDMCDIGDPSMLNSEVDDLPQRCSECIDEATRYVCHKWSYHLARSTTTASMDESLAKFLVEFSRKSILHWVETLSLLGAMDIVITMLHDAISWLKLIPTPPEDTLTLFKDTQRLALMFFDPISVKSKLS